MTWPTVTELPRSLEPVTRDPFADAMPCVRITGGSYLTPTLPKAAT